MSMSNSIEKEIRAKLEKEQSKVIKTAVNRLKAATPVDTGKAQAGWRSEQYKIYNNVEYIDKLNRGSSKQAPTHFVERTLLSIKGIKPNGVIVK